MTGTICKLFSLRAARCRMGFRPQMWVRLVPNAISLRPLFRPLFSPSSRGTSMRQSERLMPG
jgi:hypothetical protein